MKRLLYILVSALVVFSALDCRKTPEQDPVTQQGGEEPEEPENPVNPGPDEPDKPGPDVPDNPEPGKPANEERLVSKCDVQAEFTIDGEPRSWVNKDVVTVAMKGFESKVFNLRYNAREARFVVDTLVQARDWKLERNSGTLNLLWIPDSGRYSFEDGHLSAEFNSDFYIATDVKFQYDDSENILSISADFHCPISLIRISGCGGPCELEGMVNSHGVLKSLSNLEWGPTKSVSSQYKEAADAVEVHADAPNPGNKLSLLFASQEKRYTRKVKDGEDLSKIHGPKNKPGEWEMAYTFEYYRTGEYITYTKSSKSKPVTIIITGDGFTRDHNRRGAEFERYATAAADAIFNVEPYKTYKDYFNVYLVAAESKQQGADIEQHELNGNKAVTKDTYFDTGWTSRTSYTSMISSAGTTTLRQFIANTPGYDASRTFTAVLCNEYTYGGVCYWMGSPVYCFISLCLNSSLDAPRGLMWNNAWDSNTGTSSGNYLNTLVHELCGHAIARLTDEYANASFSRSDVIAKHFIDYSWNLSDSATNTPWKEFKEAIEADGGYTSGKYGVGEFLCKNDVYRSDYIGCMVDNRFVWGAWNRYLIARRIHSLVGESYSIEQFIREVPKQVVDPAWKVNRSPALNRDTLTDWSEMTMEQMPAEPVCE